MILKQIVDLTNFVTNDTFTNYTGNTYNQVSTLSSETWNTINTLSDNVFTLSSETWYTINNLNLFNYTLTSTTLTLSSETWTTINSMYSNTRIDQPWIDINRSGFLNQTETNISFDGVNTFMLSPVNTTWSYYRLGIKYIINGSKSIVLPSSPVSTDKYFIFIDNSSGDLNSATTAWTIDDNKIAVSIIYFNDTLTPKFLMAEERHSCLIDTRMHKYLHETRGTQFVSGGELSNLSASTDTDISKRPIVALSVIDDEDINQTLPQLTPNSADTTSQDYFIKYRIDSSTWLWNSSNMPFVYNSGTNLIQWDNNGTLVDGIGGNGANARWYNSYILMTNQSGSSRFTIVAGRGSFNSLALAQTEDATLFDWTGLLISEGVIAWQLTWTINSNSYTSQGGCVYAASKKVNIGFSSITASGAGVDHNTLAGLQGGASNEYYHLSLNDYTNLVTTPVFYTQVQSNSNFLSANTSYYTQIQSNSNFLSANTSFYTTAQTAANFLSANTILSATLTGLTDVSVSALTNAQILIYTGSTNKWTNVSGLDLLSIQVDAGGIFYTSNQSDALYATIATTYNITQSNANFLSSTTTLNVQTSNYTLALIDLNNFVVFNSAGTLNCTIPANSTVTFNIGSRINVVQSGSGQVQFVANSPVILSYGAGTKTKSQNSVATVLKTATNSWLLYGDIST